MIPGAINVPDTPTEGGQDDLPSSQPRSHADLDRQPFEEGLLGHPYSQGGGEQPGAAASSSVAGLVPSAHVLAESNA